MMNQPPPLAPRMHAIQHTLHGSEMQFVEIELDPGESVVAEAGGMMYMEDGIAMETVFGDGSAAAGYLAATSANSAATSGGVPVLSSGAFAPTLSGGKVYAAADTIDITLGTAIPAAAVVRIFAMFTDIN